MKEFYNYIPCVQETGEKIKHVSTDTKNILKNSNPTSKV